MALTDIITSPLTTDIGASEFVIVHGEYGTSKSHVLRFFATLINDRESDVFNAVATYIPTIKLDQKMSFLRIYKEIIGSTGVPRLKEYSLIIQARFNSEKEMIKGQLSKEELLDGAGEDGRLSERVFQSVDDTDRPMLKLMLELANGNEDAGRYLMGQKATVPEAGLTSPVDSDYVASKTLGGLFRVLTLAIGEQEPVCHGTYLFLDEVEAILEEKQADLSQFFQGVRELVNELPYNFCLLMAFSADAALLEAVIPRAVLERLTRAYLELPSLTPEEAKEFIAGRLEQHRPDDFTNTNRFHPFAEPAIEVCLEYVVEMTPRRLFRTLHTVLVRSIQREGLTPGDEISAELADAILTSGGY